MSQRTRQTLLPGMGDEPEKHPAARVDAGTVGVPPLGGESERGPRRAEAGTPTAGTPTTPTDLPARTVWVIDAHSLIHQVFHAIPEMTSPRGEPVSAVYGFTRDLFYLLETKRPDYLFAAFDLPGKTFRHALLEAYKIHRPAMHEDLVPQFPAIRRVLEALGVPALGVESYEADDILATVAARTEELGGTCFLVTGDKDCRQLITDRVKVYNIRKDAVFDADALIEEWGIRPDQVVDFQAMVGDAVDNVPGISLIGPKIAGELLRKYGTLEEVLAHAEEVAGVKRKENLIAGRKQALLSRKLVELDRRVPLDLDWELARVKPFDPAPLLALFEEFGFHRLGEQAVALGGRPAASSQWKADYRTVDTPEALADLVELMSHEPCISVDTETTSIWPAWAQIVGYSFAWKDGEAYYVPVRAPAGEPCLDPAATLAALRPILENPSIAKVGQNLKYDMIVLRSAGVELAGVAFDTMVASYLLEAGERNHNLDELAKRHLGHATIKIDTLIGSGKNQKRMDEVPVALVTPYAAEDADVAWRLRPILARELAFSSLEELFRSLELPLIDVLVEMESNGIKVDVGRLKELSDEFGARILALEQEIYDLAGHPFNIASPKQLQEVLFDQQKLPISKKTKTGASTDVEVLEELALQHPLPAKIIEYRQYAKLKGTYVDALPAMVHPKTGRVHASFNQVVTATGRLSSSDPNLQNIPIRSESGRAIRSAFLPGHEGWRLLAADYSQIELRVLAHFSGDETLLDAFAGGRDIHAEVASQVYGVPLDQVTSAMRRSAKVVNFGVLYGQSPVGLAKQLGIPQSEAADYIDAYFARYPGVEKFLVRTLEECRKKGYVCTVLGRRRAIRGIREGVGRYRNLPERTAVNTVIQGSAADLIKKAMIAIHRRLRSEKLPAKMLLQIHDELVFEVPSEEVDSLARLVAAEMAGVLPLKVPLGVDVKSGANWADVEPWGDGTLG
ncbi:MAG: DNA polymerase I [Pirellulales bacterium]